jgi:hypothetical protein
MRNIILYLLVLTSLASCTRYAYYQSPLLTHTNTYRALPLLKDSIQSATYANIAYSIGGANHEYRDGFYAFMGDLHQSHSFGRFHVFYGATASLGRYTVDSITQTDNERSSFFNRSLNDSLINLYGGHKTFRSWGFIGGATYVVPYDHGEWRALGVEFSWNNELGDYLDFRRKLPDTAANLIDRKQKYLTLTFSTEALRELDDHSILAYKAALGFKLHNVPGYNKMREPYSYNSAYLSQTISFTHHWFTGFGTATIGSSVVSFQLGSSFRLGKWK